MNLNVAGLNQLSGLSRAFDAAGPSAGRQVRGASAKALDAAEAEAKRNAVAQWSDYGRGLRGTAGTIRARMSNSEETVGYLFADGPGAAMQETGTGHHPPQPVMRQAVDNNLGRLVDEFGNIGTNVL